MALLGQKGNKVDECLIIAGLLEAIEQAQKSGDWVVDGACDPDMVIDAAEVYLRAHGWTRNSIDDTWMLAA